VKEQGEVEPRKLLKPVSMASDFRRESVIVVAVQVNAFRGGPAVDGEPTRVQAGTDPEVGVRRQGVLPQQLDAGEGTRGFVAMDTGGEVESAGFHRACGCGTVCGQKAAPIVDGKFAEAESTERREFAEFHQHSRDVDCLSVIPVGVSSQALHRASLAGSGLGSQSQNGCSVHTWK
jgi:hypothetical protein